MTWVAVVIKTGIAGNAKLFSLLRAPLSYSKITSRVIKSLVNPLTRLPPSGFPVSCRRGGLYNNREHFL